MSSIEPNHTYIYKNDIALRENVKPNYIFIYKNDIAIKEFVKHDIFSWDCFMRDENKDRHSFVLEYQYFTLRCFQMDKPIPHTMGNRAIVVFIEEELWDMMDKDFYADVIEPMTNTNKLLGNVKILNINNLKMHIDKIKIL